MTARNIFILCLIIFVVGISFGYFVMPTKTITTVKTVEVEKVENNKEDKVIAIKKLPNGEIDEVITDNTNDNTTTDSQSTTKTAETISHGSSKFNISALAGVSSQGVSPITYGISMQKSVIGPIGVGAFFLTNGTIGASIGINF